MAIEIGAGPGSNFHIYPGQTVRLNYWWGATGNGPQFAFAAPAFYATLGSRVISSNQAVQQLHEVDYMADLTCDDMRTDMGQPSSLTSALWLSQDVYIMRRIVVTNSAGDIIATAAQHANGGGQAPSKNGPEYGFIPLEGQSVHVVDIPDET